MAPQRGQDVFNCLLSLSGSTRWWTWQSSQYIYTVIEVLDYFVRCLVPHKLNGRYICLWVQPQQALQAACQMNLSASFLPCSAACRNISWRMMDWWGHLSPIWGIHLRIVQCQDANLPPRLTALSLLPTPWQTGTYATCPHSVVLATYDN